MVLKNNNNNDYDSDPTAYRDAVGGKNQKWKLEIEKLSKSSLKDHFPSGLEMEEYLDVILQKNNRIDCPIILDPNIASFIEVAFFYFIPVISLEVVYAYRLVGVVIPHEVEDVEELQPLLVYPPHPPNSAVLG